jgi:two-component system, OmpR family, heavy metal sensor histidine kinase CusS
MFPSLRSRLITLIGIGTTALFLVGSIAISLIFESSLWSEFDSALFDRARNLGQLIEQEEHGLSFEWLEGVGLPSPIWAEREVLTVWSDGKMLEVLPPKATPINVPLISGPRAFDIRLDDGTRARAIEFRFAPRIVIEGDVEQQKLLVQPKVSLMFARSTSDIQSAISVLRWTLAGVGLLGVFGTLGMSWFVVGIGLLPIQSATQRIGAIRAGTLSERLQDIESQPQELRPLLTTINQLLGRLEQAFARERSFSADVAHELRTPLAGLRAQFELALARTRSSEDYVQTIRKCLEITIQTGAIVESLLETTRNAKVTHAMESVPLRVLIVDLLKESASIISIRHLEVDNQVPTHLAINTDQQSLTIILRNVLQNAVSHSDVHSSVEISTSEVNLGCLIVVSNRASTFPVDDIDKVFDRFWRADPSRHETGCHSGLGLSLCQRLAQRCGANLEASCDGGVFRMKIFVPF